MPLREDHRRLPCSIGPRIMKTAVRRKEGQNCYTLAIVGNRTSHPALKGCEGMLVVRTRKGGAARPRCRRRRLLSRSRPLPPLTEDLWSSSFFGIVIRSPEPLHEDHEPLRVLLALLLLRALDHLPHQIPCLPLHFYSVAPLWVVEL